MGGRGGRGIIKHTEKKRGNGEIKRYLRYAKREKVVKIYRHIVCQDIRT